MNIKSDTVIIRRENPLVNEFDGQVIMLDPEKGNYYTFNEVGSLIWSFLKKPATPDDICKEITSKFDVEEDVCRKDALKYLEKMYSDNLLKIQNG